MSINVESIIKGYDLDKLSIATVASHTALQLLRAAYKYGFNTIAIAKPSTAWFYRQFNFIKEVIEVDFSEFESLIDRLIRENAILIPHGSYVEYVGWRKALSVPVPTFGNRYLIKWESDQKLKMKLLEYAGILIPRSYDDPATVDGPVIVKLYGAKGGRGYFLARNKDELIEKLRNVKDDYIIQEYVIGVPAYYHYFTSRIYGRVEIMGMDIRYESNVDGRTFGLSEPTFVVVGNLPMVVRESLLPIIQKYGEQFTKAVNELIPPGMIGPFSLESIIKDDMTIVVFEFSGRIVAGTNVYMGIGSPYSLLYFDKPMDMGERIMHEINEAIGKGRIIDIVT